MQNVDVAIVGGGMVGLALACGSDRAAACAWPCLSKKRRSLWRRTHRRSCAISAINAASAKLLTHLGVWSEIVALRASCYHGMEVWDKDSFGHIAFDDESMGYSHLETHR